MSLFFSSFREESEPEDEFKSITGYDTSKEDIDKDIERLLENGYTSRREHKQLLNLQAKLNNNKQS